MLDANFIFRALKIASITLWNVPAPENMSATWIVRGHERSLSAMEEAWGPSAIRDTMISGAYTNNILVKLVYHK